MGFRFQKRIKLLPGVTLNLSKGGVSTSLGTTGARVTYGHGKQRTTVGIPGTGLSHTTQKTISPDGGSAIAIWLVIAVVAAVFFFFWSSK